MQTEVITVIIPTYQPGSYITACLNSLCTQTLSREKFQVLVVLNGPKSPYYQSLYDYAQSHAPELNMQLLYTEEKGVSRARNIGIEQANGTYIVFLDDDDFLSPNYLQNLLQQAAPQTIVLTNAIAIDQEQAVQSHFLTKAYKYQSGKRKHTLLNTRSFFSVPVCKIIPRDVIASQRFFTDFTLGEDALFMFALSPRIQHIRFTTPDTIYYIRLRPNSASRQQYSYTFRLRLAMRTILRYSQIYLQSPRSFNLPFFLTRIAATIRKLFQKNYT